MPNEAVNPITNTLAKLRQVLASLSHNGVSHLPTGWRDDCNDARRELATQSLFALSDAVKALLKVVLSAQPLPKDTRIARSQMRLAALTQLHQDAHVTLA